jgi:D-glycero-D-manno-heptose 1,7-bisphosphate phosphatase
MHMKKNIAVFFDRDGTINEEAGYLDHMDKLKIIPVAYEAIKQINLTGMKAIVITNQSGVARGYFTEEFVIAVNRRIQSDLNKNGAIIDKFFYCPHHPTEGKGIYLQKCTCRKPAPGMLLSAAREFNISLTESYLVGDTFLDIQAAKAAGLKAVLVKTGYGTKLLQDDALAEAAPENKPDFIAEDILDAVQWICRDRQNNK